jgi:hypothetical protein
MRQANIDERGDMVRTALSIILLGLVLSVRPCGAAWDPESFRDVDTLDFLTVGPEEGEHWSPVWLVVLDGHVYIRLGSRAAERVERNTTAPYMAVKVAGQQFDRVRADPAPDMAERVAAAMADKYFTDLLIRFFPHPLTMRLVVENE